MNTVRTLEGRAQHRDRFRLVVIICATLLMGLVVGFIVNSLVTRQAQTENEQAGRQQAEGAASTNKDAADKLCKQVEALGRACAVNPSALPEPRVGATGPAGEPGAQGEPGQGGVAGQPGATGGQGQPGAPGATGAPGSAGQPGTAGQPGIQGEAGPVGPQGPAGPQGEQGAKGNTGESGRGVASTQVSQEGNTCTMIVTYTDGTSQNAGSWECGGGGLLNSMPGLPWLTLAPSLFGLVNPRKETMVTEPDYEVPAADLLDDADADFATPEDEEGVETDTDEDLAPYLDDEEENG